MYRTSLQRELELAWSRCLCTHTAVEQAAESSQQGKSEVVLRCPATNTQAVMSACLMQPVWQRCPTAAERIALTPALCCLQPGMNSCRAAAIAPDDTAFCSLQPSRGRPLAAANLHLDAALCTLKHSCLQTAQGQTPQPHAAGRRACFSHKEVHLTAEHSPVPAKDRDHAAAACSLPTQATT